MYLCICLFYNDNNIYSSKSNNISLPSHHYIFSDEIRSGYSVVFLSFTETRHVANVTRNSPWISQFDISNLSLTYISKMHWFNGGIPEAIMSSKQRNLPFVVYIEGITKWGKFQNNPSILFNPVRKFDINMECVFSLYLRLWWILQSNGCSLEWFKGNNRLL